MVRAHALHIYDQLLLIVLMATLSASAAVSNNGNAQLLLIMAKMTNASKMLRITVYMREAVIARVVPRSQNGNTL